jgi:nitroreductase
MDDFTNIVKGRRSIRRYRDEKIPERILNHVLESVKWSPSWANSQCWEVVVVQDQARKERLQKTLGKTNPSSKAIVQAPVVLALCGKKESAGYYKGQGTTKFGDWFMFDLGIATQSICLAAQSAGLGTVIVGMFDHDKAREILAVKDEYELVVLIPMGYASKESSAPRRREISEFTHYDVF